MVGSNDLPRGVDNAENDGSSLLVALDGQKSKSETEQMIDERTEGRRG
jgi:hypothetical protein